MMILKNKPAISTTIRKSARGQDCMFQIPNICNHNPETTVLCHLPNRSYGMSQKGHDFIAAYGCSSCHDEIDRRTRYMTMEHRKAFMYDALVEALNVFYEQGFLSIKGAK